jgi:hypothetical protein
MTDARPCSTGERVRGHASRSWSSVTAPEAVSARRPADEEAGKADEPTSLRPVRVVSWNHRRTTHPGQLDFLRSLAPDLLLLQDVSSASLARLTPLFEEGLLAWRRHRSRAANPDGSVRLAGVAFSIKADIADPEWDRGIDNPTPWVLGVLDIESSGSSSF